MRRMLPGEGPCIGRLEEALGAVMTFERGRGTDTVVPEGKENGI